MKDYTMLVSQEKYMREGQGADDDMPYMPDMKVLPVNKDRRVVAMKGVTLDDIEKDIHRRLGCRY